MFQLIVVVLSVILIVALTAVAAWYGGKVYEESSSRALYNEYTNKVSQLEGALHLYYVNNGGVYPKGDNEQVISELIQGGYLNGLDGEWAIGYEEIVRGVEREARCEAINKAAGFDVEENSCPPCDDEAYSDWPVCQVP